MAKLYIPIEHKPSSVLPAFWAGTSISVIPEIGRLFLYFKLGITKADEQSKVPFVSIRIIVGISALASVFLG